MKILIAGDSFAAKWPNKTGWVDLLAEQHQVTNVAQAGISEYKILKQIEGVDLSTFDLVIVSHTSPSRIHVKEHPLHKTGFHKDCDLIYTDLKGRKSFFNKKLNVAIDWFENFYDEDYQIDIYKLIREKINNNISIPYISLSHVPIVNELTIETNHIDFSDLWAHERGDSNHYTMTGNRVILQTVINEINLLGKENE